MKVLTSTGVEKGDNPQALQFSADFTLTDSGEGATEIALTNVDTVETVVATNVITAEESGKTFFLGVAGGFTSTLPAPAAGLRYKFIVSVAPTTAYIIGTNGAADIMKGSVNEAETDTTEDGPSDQNGDVLNFVANVALPGDWVEFISDGTSWFFTGQTIADGAVTVTNT